MDRHLLTEVSHIPLQLLVVMYLGIGDLQGLITKCAAVMAIEPPVLYVEEDPLPPNRDCLDETSSFPLLRHPIPLTDGTSLLPFVDVKDKRSLVEFGLLMAVVDSTKGVVYDTRGHLVKPPLKVVLENFFKEVSGMSSLLSTTSGTHYPDEPNT